MTAEPTIIYDPDGTPMHEVWKIRKVGEEIRPASWFLANPYNWRIHPQGQRKALTGVLSDLGWLDSVKVNLRSSDLWGENRGIPTLFDGHCRIEEALKVGESTAVPLEYYDLDPSDEAEALATLDPISALAVAAPAQLDLVIRGFNSDNEDVQRLVDDLAKMSGLYNSEGTPSLDTLGQTYGDHDESTFWPEIRIKVPPSLHAKWVVFWESVGGDDDPAKLQELMDRAEP